MKSRWNMHINLRLRLSISNTSTTIIQCKTTEAANEQLNLKLKLAKSRVEQLMTIVDVARKKKAWKTLCWNWNFITDEMYQVMFFSYPFTVKISTWWSVSAASAEDIEFFSPSRESHSLALTTIHHSHSFALFWWGWIRWKKVFVIKTTNTSSLLRKLRFVGFFIRFANDRINK